MRARGRDLQRWLDPRGVPVDRLVELWQSGVGWHKPIREALLERYPESRGFLTGREVFLMGHLLPFEAVRARELAEHPGFPFPDWQHRMPTGDEIYWTVGETQVRGVRAIQCCLWSSRVGRRTQRLAEEVLPEGFDASERG